MAAPLIIALLLEMASQVFKFGSGVFLLLRLDMKAGWLDDRLKRRHPRLWVESGFFCFKILMIAIHDRMSTTNGAQT